MAMRMTRRDCCRMVGGLGLATLLPRPRLAFAQQQTQSVTELTKLFDDVYLYRSIGHQAIFIVTDDGVFATDPIGLGNPRAPQLYKAAIASVTDQPVKFVIYSHDHVDHIKGGVVFADTARYLSHNLAAPKIAARNDPLTPAPTLTFGEYLAVDLGGRVITLHYAGRNHSDNSIVLMYPARRLAFAVDFIPVDSLPFRNLGDSYPEEWIESLAWVEANLDFDLLVPGHGPLGAKDHVRQMREYFEDLLAAIRAAREQGLPDNSDAMVASVRAALAPRYGSWASFGPYLPENIQGVIQSWSG
jgi:glyoxylase-like metal-dependent hydrolase (beta-lactamase superfamily II)